MAFGKYFKAIEEQTTSEDVTVVLDPQEEAVAAGADTAGDVLEVQERIAQIDAGEDAIDSAVDETEVVEEHIENAEASLADGGMDQTAATAMDIATESFCRKMGLQRSKPAGMAIESFGGTSTRLRATKLAIEEAKGMAGKAWEAILAFIEKAKKFVIETWSRIFNAKDRIIARAKAIAEKAKNYKGGQGDVTKAGLSAKVCIDGTVDAGKVVKFLTEAPVGLQEVSDVVGKAAAGLVKLDFDNLNVSTAKLLNDTIEICERAKIKELSADKYDAPEGATVLQVALTIPGDFASIAIFKKDPESPFLKQTVVKLVEHKAPEGDKLPRMTPEQVVKACQGVEELAKALKQVDTMMKTFKTHGDTLINKIKNIRSKDERAAQARRNLTQLYSFAADPVVKASAALMKSFAATLDWANLSVTASKED